MSRSIYSGEKTKEISFPVGGLGTGCIGLAGNGRLIDWEIFNRPNKGSVNGFSHFAVKAERDGDVLDARVLNGDLSDAFSGVFGREVFYQGFGWGPLRETMGGMPHFQEHQFHGTFPFAEITFTEEAFPGDVKLLAFNPFIPTNDYDSGIPAAFLEINLTNTTDEATDYTVVGVLGNVFGPQGFNEIQQGANRLALHIGTDDIARDDFKYGDLTLATDAENCSYQEYWYRGLWADALETYWRDFTSPGQFTDPCITF
jgi:non-lysosomal glucosylceramidase